jgi:membrane protein implicated in regulation of membrane protease activity
LLLAPMLALASLVAWPAVAAERVVELEIDAAALQVTNLAGSVRIVPGADAIVLRATVKADDAALAEAIRFDQEQSGDTASVSVRLPDGLDEVRYEDEQFRRLDARLEYEGDRIRVRSNDGERLRVDLELQIPQGTRLELRQGVGDIGVTGVDADLNLSLNFGHVRAADGQGALVALTRAGDIEVRSQRGQLDARSGSGDVDIENMLGTTRARTGSGDVSLRGVDGEMQVETGSGDLELADVIGSLRARTGSGDVEIRGLGAGPTLDIATGSGDVEAAGDLGALRDVTVRTGSGDVRLASNSPLSLQVSLATGSGGIKVDVPVLGNVESGRRSFKATIGSGEGEARINTGSGDISIKAP